MSLQIDPELHDALIEDGGNHDDSSPLVKALQMILGLFLLLIVFTFFLVTLADFVIEHIPDTAVRKIHVMARDLPVDAVSRPPARLQEYLKLLLDELVQKSEVSHLDFELFLSGSEEVNAYAYPGHRIILTKGLLQEAKSRNELAMVLGHELGHFQARDILKGFSQQVMALMVFGVFMPSDHVSEVFQGSFQMSLLQFSRTQESQADEVALRLVSRVFDRNCSGVTDFFRRERDDLLSLAWLKYLSTHPASKDRVRGLEEATHRLKMEERGVSPLPEWWALEVAQLEGDSPEE